MEAGWTIEEFKGAHKPRNLRLAGNAPCSDHEVIVRVSRVVLHPSSSSPTQYLGVLA
jgi:hypothetical protein